MPTDRFDRDCEREPSYAVRVPRVDLEVRRERGRMNTAAAFADTPENRASIACYRQHAAIKADDARWSALPLVGQQDDGEGGALELRDCTCGSTLARPVRLEPA